jgi:hypothetical protein
MQTSTDRRRLRIALRKRAGHFWPSHFSAGLSTGITIQQISMANRELRDRQTHARFLEHKKNNSQRIWFRGGRDDPGRVWYGGGGADD